MLNKGNIFLIDYAIKKMTPEGVILQICSFGSLSINLNLYLLAKIIALKI